MHSLGAILSDSSVDVSDGFGFFAVPVDQLLFWTRGLIYAWFGGNV